MDRRTQGWGERERPGREVGTGSPTGLEGSAQGRKAGDGKSSTAIPPGEFEELCPAPLAL